MIRKIRVNTHMPQLRFEPVPTDLPSPRCFLLNEIEKEEKEKLWYYSQLQGLSKRLDELPHVETVSTREYPAQSSPWRGERKRAPAPHPGAPLTAARPPLPAVLDADGSDSAAARVRGPAHSLADGGALRHLGRDGAAGTGAAGQGFGGVATHGGPISADILNGLGYMPAGEAEGGDSCG